MDKKPRTIEVPICLDQDVEQAALAARRDLDTTAQQLLETFNARVRVAQTLSPDDDAETVARRIYDEDEARLADLKAAAEVAEADLRDACQTFTFQSIGFKAWRALKAAHPSKNKDLIFDVDALAPALLRDASVDPKLSAGQVEDLLNSPDWSEGEINLLIGAAVAVQS